MHLLFRSNTEILRLTQDDEYSTYAVHFDAERTKTSWPLQSNR